MQVVVDGPHGDGALEDARLELEGSGGGLVVLWCERRTVRRGVVHGHSLAARTAQRHGKIDGTAFDTFGGNDPEDR